MLTKLKTILYACYICHNGNCCWGLKKALKTTVMYLLTGYTTLKAINWKDENLLIWGWPFKVNFWRGILRSTMFCFLVKFRFVLVSYFLTRIVTMKKNPAQTCVSLAPNFVFILQLPSNITSNTDQPWYHGANVTHLMLYRGWIAKVGNCSVI